MHSNAISCLIGLSVLLCGAFEGAASVEQACQGVPNGYFARDKSSCGGYYYCNNGGAIFNFCPDDFYFNELTQRCDYPEKVSCHVCQQQTGVQVLAHPQNCNQFIMCSEGYSSVGQCAEGYLFDGRQGVCHPSARVDCTASRCPEQDNPNQIVYLPSMDRCDEYFICQSGMAVQKFCAPGLRWDVINERCDLTQNVSCTL
uniref:Chitin-binding type-2 domain-containing protein n=1 Tax=Anopheles atroparvus TaxID=41427 RepID=A0A182J6X9_ANOAO